jgi:hypothetical protein
MSLHSVNYFPHNDSAVISFGCGGRGGGGGVGRTNQAEVTTRTRVCSFAEETRRTVEVDNSRAEVSDRKEWTKLCYS